MTDEISWFEGDIHNHEDGSLPIGDHVDRVRKAGYDFICLQYKDMEDPKRVPDPVKISRDDVLVIPGAEQAFQSARGLWAHFGFMPFDIPMPDTITDHFNIERGMAEAERRSPGCLKIVHHPSDGRWTMEDLKNAYRFGTRFFELNPSRESLEYALELWDKCLSSGLALFATLSTDAHGLGGIRRFGYVKVHARSLKQSDILSSLMSGDFVSVQEGCRASPVEILIPDGNAGGTYEVIADGAVKVRFMGAEGRVLDEAEGGKAMYEIVGNEGYVRAEAADEYGLRFFAQPVMIRGS